MMIFKLMNQTLHKVAVIQGTFNVAIVAQIYHEL